MSSLARLIYLGAEHRPQLPSKDLLKFLPQSDLLGAVTKKGIQGAAADLSLPLEQIQHLYSGGRDPDRGSPEEFRTLVAQTLMAEIELHRDEVSMSDYLSRIRAISEYLENKAEGPLVHREEADLGALNEPVPLVKWNTGFTPLDVAMGGMYNGIVTWIGRPGSGKTSMMLTIMEALRGCEAASSVWYYELEIPLPLMLYRASPSMNRVKYISGKDRLICGALTVQDIEKEVDANPDPGRVIIIDSPDVMAAGSGDQKRFELEKIYLGLIRLKPKVKAILVTSWPRRKDGNQITMDSVAEAWSKAWYSDVIIGAVKLGRVADGYNTVRLTIAKNRFGLADQEIQFSYNYGDLTFKVNEAAVAAMEGDDW